MQFEWQANTYCMVPSYREHVLLYEAVELALVAAATGGALITLEQADTYAAYHRLDPRLDSLPISVSVDDLEYLTECLEDHAVDFRDGADHAARQLAACMRKELEFQTNDS